MNPQVGSAEYLADQHADFMVQRTLALNSEGFALRSTSRDPCSVGLAMPTDELTGLPLPIVITPPFYKNSNTEFSDYHHSFHPERDLVYGDDAEIALRRSRGQTLPRWLHEHYHKYFAGPEFPKNRQEMFATVVLACAGVIPRQAIDFGEGNGDPKVVEVAESSLEHQLLVKTIRNEAERRDDKQIYFYRAQIGMFFANYAIEQSIEEAISERVIEEFLDTKDSTRRKELGNLMVETGVRMAVEPTLLLHREIQRQGLIPRKPTSLNAKVHDFFKKSRWPDYHVALDNKWRSSIAS